jgi:streptomycin 6-kinase
MPSILLDKRFVRTIRELNGEAGLQWLENLEQLVAEIEQRWSLKVLPAFEPLSYNYVATAIQADGSEAVLKIGFPNPELTTEIEALKFFSGQGSVFLLAVDEARGVILLERLRPGAPLSRLDDDEKATSIAAGVMKRLWRPAPKVHPFPTIEKWGRGFVRLHAHFGGGCGPFPNDLVETAEALYNELAATSGEAMLLHGDLHHENILSAGRHPWLAIDPKGVVGESVYEVGALLRNPIPGLLAGPNPRGVLARRVDLLAEELGFDKERIIGWGFAQAVLSAWWSFEDQGHGWEWAIQCARLLGELIY